MKIQQHSEIGLALGGGAVLGAVHIGVLKALDENSIKVTCISGTSIGSLVASLYGCGLSGVEIEKLLSQQGWFDISKISITKMGILTNQKLGKFIDDQIGAKCFNDTTIPLAVVASDLIEGERVIIREGKIAEAVMASTSVPGIFNPVRINDRILVDGGITENLPITPLKDLGCETIVGVDLTNVKNIEPKNIFDVIMNAFNIAQHNTAKLQQVDADVVITPDLSGFNFVDTKQIPKLIELGYKHAQNVIE